MRLILIVVGLAIIAAAPALLPVFVLYMLFVGERGVSAQTIPSLILIDYKFSPEQKQPDGVVLEMVGRHPGLVARILNLLGLANKCQLEVTRQSVKVTVSRITGITHFFAPFQDVTTSDCRVEKPAWLLYLGILIGITLILSIIAPSLIYYTLGLARYVNPGFGIVHIIGIILAAGCLFFYWRSKRLVVAFSTSEIGNRYGLAFVPGVVTGKNITFEELMEYIHHINAYIVEAHEVKS
ncbi:MAG: hypothetical protein IT322_01670 [Anaerolineae bacterium]|nr:hypothetical protein [Anaerolineae bacterium]